MDALNLPSTSGYTTTQSVHYDTHHRVSEIDANTYYKGSLVKSHHDVVTYGDGMRFDNWTDTLTQTHQVIYGSSSCIYP